MNAIFQSYRYLRFISFSKRNNLVLILDKPYKAAIFIVGFLYLSIYISSLVDVFMNIEKYYDWNLPFITYTVPLMIITFNVLINQGLFAYNESGLYIGSKVKIIKENIKINKVNMNLFMNRGKIVISDNDAGQKYILRTSKKKVQSFIEFFVTKNI